MATCWLPAGGGAAGVTAIGSSDQVNESTADSSTSTPSSQHLEHPAAVVAVDPPRRRGERERRRQLVEQVGARVGRAAACRGRSSADQQMPAVGALAVVAVPVAHELGLLGIDAHDIARVLPEADRLAEPEEVHRPEALRLARVVVDGRSRQPQRPFVRRSAARVRRRAPAACSASARSASASDARRWLGTGGPRARCRRSRARGTAPRGRAASRAAGAWRRSRRGCTPRCRRRCAARRSASPFARSSLASTNCTIDSSPFCTSLVRTSSPMYSGSSFLIEYDGDPTRSARRTIG